MGCVARHDAAGSRQAGSAVSARKPYVRSTESSPLALGRRSRATLLYPGPGKKVAMYRIGGQLVVKRTRGPRSYGVEVPPPFPSPAAQASRSISSKSWSATSKSAAGTHPVSSLAER